MVDIKDDAVAVSRKEPGRQKIEEIGQLLLLRAVHRIKLMLGGNVLEPP